VTALSAPDTVLLLLQTGLFDRALSLTLSFGLEVSVVIGALVDRCMSLQHTAPGTVPPLLLDEESQDSAQRALPLSGSGYTPTASHVSSITGVSERGVVSESQRAWAVLRGYLSRFDGVHTNYSLRVLVAERILAFEERVTLPTWLLTTLMQVGCGCDCVYGCDFCRSYLVICVCAGYWAQRQRRFRTHKQHQSTAHSASAHAL
jgi:hypothetical protein